MENKNCCVCRIDRLLLSERERERERGREREEKCLSLDLDIKTRTRSETKNVSNVANNIEFKMNTALTVQNLGLI